jgi:hypothetical protein
LIAGVSADAEGLVRTADFYGELPEEAMEILCAAAARPVSPLSGIILSRGGGVIATIPEDATAFGNRAATYNVHHLSMWADPGQDSTNIGHTLAVLASMKPWSTGGVYLNHIGDEGQARVRSAFTPEKWERLQALKQSRDGDNDLQGSRTDTGAGPMASTDS